MSIVPSVDNRISMGNLIVLGGMLASVAVAWGAWTTNTSALMSKMSDQSAQIAASEARIRALETATARQDERMVLILDSLRKIEARVERGPNP